MTVEELVRGVELALGREEPSACPAYDDNADSVVTVDEVMKAVDAALRGCV